MLVPSSLIRAFADDTAMAIQDFWDSADIVFEAFKKFGLASGLYLNIPKTVIVPLWSSPLEEIREDITRRSPCWSIVAVAGSAKYLGFVEGPDEGDKSWDGPCLKYTKRATLWGSQPVGLYYSATAYNTFAMSVLSYVAQLENPPEQITELEEKALRRVAPGPGRAIPSDLWYLQEHFGQTRSVKSVQVTSLAAKLRVATWEASELGGLRVKERAEALENLRTGNDYMERISTWRQWYKRSHVRTLYLATRSLKTSGIISERIIDEVAVGSMKPWLEATRLKIRSSFQAAVARQVLYVRQPDAENRVRAKMKR